MIDSIPNNSSFRPHMSFGRKIEGRKILEHLGPVFSSKKATVKLLGGGLSGKLEIEFDAGLELLHSKAKKIGGNGVINISLRITDNSRYYLMWGDVVILDAATE